MSAIWALAVLSVSLVPTDAQGAACDHLTPPVSSTSSPSRAITASDLIELRDIGNAGVADPTSPLAVSPDGFRVAFQIRQASIATNSYCLGLYVLDLKSSRRLTQVDQGGEPIMVPGIWYGAVTPKLSGYLEVNQPSWAPDGRSLFYLRKDHGVTQLWRAQADGSDAHPITHAVNDIDSFAWAADRKSILIRDLPHYPEIAAAIQREGLRGYHYDERWHPDDDMTKPIVLDRETPRVRSVDPTTGAEIAPSAPNRTPEWREPDSELVARRPDGMIAAVVAKDPADVVSDQVIDFRHGSGPSERCRASTCGGHIAGVWWARDATDLLVLRSEGWAHEDSALYRLDPKRDAASLILRTQTLLTGCRMSGIGLLCMAESALKPRHIVAIDEASGAMTTVFDPNPEFASVRLGSVRRLRWTNVLGMEAFGDLVLPPDHRNGMRHPLVVTQYQSRGFLRGGTGDAYPIQLMATQGYAVLSTQDPGPVGARKPARSGLEVNRRDVVGAADARAGLSSLATGVAMAIDTGTVNPKSIALTGLSDGAFKARYAIMNSGLFKTALISSCCDDPTSDALLGMTHMTERHLYGWPEIGDFSNPYWRSFSLLERRRDFGTPLLIQASTHEFISSIVTFAAMQQHQRPVDLYVYPDEYHVLWQPAHRAASYQRDLDWLDFWLRDRIPDSLDAVRAADFNHWRAMRDAWRSTDSANGASVRTPRLQRRTAAAAAPLPPSRSAAHP